MKQEDSRGKMATQPVNQLILSMGIPMILSMMLQAVYNIVDSAFISKMAEGGEAALNALTLAFPVQMLMVAVAIGTGVGTNALLAKCLGQGEKERASKVAGNAIFLGAVMYVVFLIFGLVGVKPYIASQTTNMQIKDMAVSYLTICCVASVGSVYFAIFEKLLQATGRSIFSTTAQVIGAVINIILDPILIYGWMGCPTLGVKGAAYATVIGQIASALTGFILHLKYNKEIDNRLKYKKPSGHIIKGIYSIGLPAIIAQALMSFMTYALNIIFVKIDESVVTAYGLYYKIQQFVLFAAFGLRDAITPIISFNHGMQSRKRVKEGMKYGILYAVIIMAVGMVLLEIFAPQFAAVFGLSGKTEGLCIDAMRIVSLSFLFAGANIAFQGIFQALDGGIESLIVSLCRQFLFVIPVAWVFSKIAIRSPKETWLIWFTFLIAEFISMCIAVFLLKRMSHKEVGHLEVEDC